MLQYSVLVVQNNTLMFSDIYFVKYLRLSFTAERNAYRFGLT